MHASKAAAVEKLKHNLRQHGVLQRLAGLVSDIAVAPGGAVPAAQQLHQLLLVLENATFTCLENGTALTAMQVKPNGNRPGTPGPSSLLGAAAGAASDAAAAAAQPFPAVLVSVARQLLSGMDQEQPRAALHALLSVLMNLIHDNKGGGALLCSLGAMDVAAEVYSGLLQPCASRESALCVAVLQHLELLSVALGVLMNLVSNEPQHSQQLAAGKAAAATVAAGSSDGGGGDGHGDSTFVALLCTVVTALSQMLQRAEDEDAAAQETGLDDSSGVTAAEPVELGGEGCGHPFDTSAKRVSTCPAAAAAAAAGGAAELSEAFGNNKASEASIVEVYSSILLGFLVRDGGPQLAQAVAAMLPGGSLDPLLSSTARCLDFYMRTGAITDHTRTTLEGLMRELAALQMGQQGVDQGLRSVQMNATQEVADAIMVE